MTQPVADAHDRTVRWRQLVDLLSRPHDEIDPALLDAALTMVRIGHRSRLPRAVRAATARSIAGRAAEPRLIAIFAADRLEVAAPLLAAAPLDEAGWAMVTGGREQGGRGFHPHHSRRCRCRRRKPAAWTSAAEPEPTPASRGAGAVDRRHGRPDRAAEEQARGRSRSRSRGEPAVRPMAQRARARRPGPNLFRWECDASGQIGWVEGAPRGALIGRSLPGEEGAPRELVRAFTDRLPFDDTPVDAADAGAGRRMAAERHPGLLARRRPLPRLSRHCPARGR